MASLKVLDNDSNASDSEEEDDVPALVASLDEGSLPFFFFSFLT
jgi:hypothetical protein